MADKSDIRWFKIRNIWYNMIHRTGTIRQRFFAYKWPIKAALSGIKEN